MRWHIESKNQFLWNWNTCLIWTSAWCGTSATMWQMVHKCSEKLQLFYKIQLILEFPLLGKTKPQLSLRLKKQLLVWHEIESRKDLQRWTRNGHSDTGFWKQLQSCFSLSGQTPDVSSSQSLLLSHIPSHRARPCTQLKITFSGWHRQSFKQSMKKIS